MRHHGRLAHEAPNDAMPALRNVGVPNITSVTAPKTWRFTASEIVNVDARSCYELGRAWGTILETTLYQPVKVFLKGSASSSKAKSEAAICWRRRAATRRSS